ncbi:MAG TPA: HAMP domain-containing sensor histidine kinase [Acidimicrobiales bacterium]|nr:HAMP domain-containing sensor histidine kinase [Acidimicrobiales bacterium]
MKRLLSQSVRVRLSLLYASLFLAAGAVLLGVMYALLASNLPQPTAAVAAKSLESNLQAACKGAELGQERTKHSTTPVPVPAACQRAFAEGAAAAAIGQRNTTLHDLLLFSLLGLAGMTLVSGGLGWTMAGRVLRPVRRITGAAQRASGNHLGERLAMAGPDDELKQLADTFDEMLDRLDTAFANQQRFVADASHELRTPLTVMRTAIDVTLAKPEPTPDQLQTMAAKLRRSIDRSEALIGALLTLATSEQGLTVRESVDLATLAEDALDDVGATISQLGLTIEADLDPAEATGDPILVGRLVANLVENAVRHNVAGGWLSVRTGISDGRAHIEVSNTGPVVPEDLLSSLFEPFRRAEERTGSPDGVGLGLAIVRGVATAHGAELEANSRGEGGLVLSVRFPPLRAIPSLPEGEIRDPNQSVV